MVGAIERQHPLALGRQRDDRHFRHRVAVEIPEREVVFGEDMTGIFVQSDVTAIHLGRAVIHDKIGDGGQPDRRSPVIGKGDRERQLPVEIARGHRVARRRSDLGFRAVARNPQPAVAVAGAREPVRIADKAGVGRQRPADDRLAVDMDASYGGVVDSGHVDGHGVGGAFAAVRRYLEREARIAVAAGIPLRKVGKTTAGNVACGNSGAREDRFTIPEGAPRRKSLDQHAVEAVSVGVGEIEVCEREGVFHVLVGCHGAARCDGRIVHRRYVDRQRAAGGAVRSPVADLEGQRRIGRSVFVRSRCKPQFPRIQPGPGDRLVCDRGNRRVARIGAGKGEAAPGGNGHERHAGKAVAVDIDKAEIGDAEDMGRVLGEGQRAVGAVRRIVHRRHIDTQRVIRPAVGTAVIHAELEARKAAAVCVARRRVNEFAAVEVADGNRLPRRHVRAVERQPARGRQGRNLHACKRPAVAVREGEVARGKPVVGILVGLDPAVRRRREVVARNRAIRRVCSTHQRVLAAAVVGEGNLNRNLRADIRSDRRVAACLGPGDHGPGIGVPGDPEPTIGICGVVQPVRVRDIGEIGCQRLSQFCRAVDLRHAAGIVRRPLDVDGHRVAVGAPGSAVMHPEGETRISVAIAIGGRPIFQVLTELPEPVDFDLRSGGYRNGRR